MRFARILVLTLLVISAATGKDVFELKVTRVRTLRKQDGSLHVDAKGIAFRSTDGKTAITIYMQDLREADVADPRSLRFETYEVEKWKPIKRHQYTFRAQSEAPVEELAQFLAARVHRPVVGRYANASLFQVPAFHRRLRTGTSGILEIGEDSIQFVSRKPADSRTWLYRNIETIGRPDPFRLRVTTSRETYVIELKEDLPEAAYQFAWNKIYGASAEPQMRQHAVSPP
jgi:hypothetical protein